MRLAWSRRAATAATLVAAVAAATASGLSVDAAPSHILSTQDDSDISAALAASLSSLTVHEDDANDDDVSHRSRNTGRISEDGSIYIGDLFTFLSTYGKSKLRNAFGTNSRTSNNNNDDDDGEDTYDEMEGSNAALADLPPAKQFSVLAAELDLLLRNHQLPPNRQTYSIADSVERLTEKRARAEKNNNNLKMPTIDVNAERTSFHSNNVPSVSWVRELVQSGNRIFSGVRSEITTTRAKQIEELFHHSLDKRIKEISSGQNAELLTVLAQFLEEEVDSHKESIDYFIHGVVGRALEFLLEKVQVEFFNRLETDFFVTDKFIADAMLGVHDDNVRRYTQLFASARRVPISYIYGNIASVDGKHSKMPSAAITREHSELFGTDVPKRVVRVTFKGDSEHETSNRLNADRYAYESDGTSIGMSDVEIISLEDFSAFDLSEPESMCSFDVLSCNEGSSDGNPAGSMDEVLDFVSDVGYASDGESDSRSIAPIRRVRTPAPSIAQVTPEGSATPEEEYAAYADVENLSSDDDSADDISYKPELLTDSLMLPGPSRYNIPSEERSSISRVGGLIRAWTPRYATKRWSSKNNQQSSSHSTSPKRRRRRRPIPKSQGLVAQPDVPLFRNLLRDLQRDSGAIIQQPVNVRNFNTRNQFSHLSHLSHTKVMPPFQKIFEFGYGTEETCDVVNHLIQGSDGVFRDVVQKAISNFMDATKAEFSEVFSYAIFSMFQPDTIDQDEADTFNNDIVSKFKEQMTDLSNTGGATIVVSQDTSADDNADSDNTVDSDSRVTVDELADALNEEVQYDDILSNDEVMEERRSSVVTLTRRSDSKSASGFDMNNLNIPSEDQLHQDESGIEDEFSSPLALKSSAQFAPNIVFSNTNQNDVPDYDLYEKSEEEEESVQRSGGTGSGSESDDENDFMTGISDSVLTFRSADIIGITKENLLYRLLRSLMATKPVALRNLFLDSDDGISKKLEDMFVASFSHRSRSIVALNGVLCTVEATHNEHDVD